jgi:hypothetical protein
MTYQNPYTPNVCGRCEHCVTGQNLFGRTDGRRNTNWGSPTGIDESGYGTRYMCISLLVRQD